MYFNKKMRRKKLEELRNSSKPQQLVSWKTSKKKRGKDICYYEKSIYHNSNSTLKPINYFIKQIKFLIDSNNNFIRMSYYNSFNNWVDVKISQEVIDILCSLNSKCYVLSNGIILVYTKKEIFITYDFYKYQIVNVNELQEYFNHEENAIYSICGLSDDDEIILSEYGTNKQYYLPYKIKCNFSHDNAWLMFYLKYEI